MNSVNVDQNQMPVFEKVSGKRQVLGEILPLEAPLSINVTAANVKEERKHMTRHAGTVKRTYLLHIKKIY